jgi:hypothetical protein
MKNVKKDDPALPSRPIRVRQVKDAARLLGRVLMQLQKDEISDTKAKTISYVCNSYIKSCEVSTLETRIGALEANLLGPRSTEEGG